MPERILVAPEYGNFSDYWKFRQQRAIHLFILRNLENRSLAQDVILRRLAVGLSRSEMQAARTTCEPWQAGTVANSRRLETEVSPATSRQEVRCLEGMIEELVERVAE